MRIELAISRGPYRIDSKKEKEKLYIYCVCVCDCLGVFCVQFEIEKIGKLVFSH